MPATLPSRRPRGPVRLIALTARHVAIHALNLALYVFMALLALVAGLLIFLLSRDDIPLPDFLLRRIESRLAQAGIEASFSRARLDLHGNVLINELRLEPSRFHEPVLEAGVVLLNFDELFLAAGMIELTSLRAENVTISCPSALSPSGAPFPLVRISGVSLERAGRAWRLNGLLASAGNLRLTLHGTATPPPKSGGVAMRLDPSRIVDEFARVAPQAARAIQRLEALTGARADLGFQVDKTGDVRVAVEASAAAWAEPGLGEARDIRIATNLLYARGRLVPFEVRATAAHAERSGLGTVEHLGVVARWDKLPDLRSPIPASVTLSGARLTHPKATVVAPTAVASLVDFPRMDILATLQLAGEPLELHLAGDVSTRAGELELRGRFGRDWLAEASRIQGRDLTYYAQIAEPPDFWARVSLAGGAWTGAEFRGLAGPITARGVALDRARVHGFAVPERLTIDHLEIARGDQGGVGTYTDLLRTREHRLLLRGSMRPHLISPWFSGWWERFWGDFTFDGPPPEFDIDVSGNWNIQGSDVVRGRGSAAHGTMRGIGYESLSTRFFVRMDYYDLYDATLVRPEGRVAGEVQLLFRPPQRDAARTSFSFESTADLVELAGVFGPGGDALLEPYRYTVPPRTRVSGVVTNDQGSFDTVLDVRIESPAEFRYYDFPVSSISTDVRIHNSHVEIPRLIAGYAGGTLRARAVADNGILDVHASLDSASYDDATHIFNDFLDRRSPPTTEERDPAGLTAQRPGGRLSLGVDARGPITTFDAYEGSGSLRISEANLGSIRIFGLLSDLMGSISPKLGSLRFHEANSTFHVQRDRVAFPDLRITGRTAALETEGTYYINSKNLDFRARLYPLGESGNAITQLFDFVLGPVSYLLEMRLTGTLRKPNWALSRLPFAPKPVIDEGTPSTPQVTPSAGSGTVSSLVPAVAPDDTGTAPARAADSGAPVPAGSASAEPSHP